MVNIKIRIITFFAAEGGKALSVQFSCSVVSDLLWPHGLQHARPPCPSPTPRVYSNSCPLSQWCLPTISHSVVPFSSCLQSFPASGSFQMNQFFASGGQSIGVSTSTSVLPVNIQDWFPLGWTDWISLQSKGLSRVFSNTTVQKHQFFGTQLFFNHPTLTSIHNYWKNHSLDYMDLVGKVISLVFNMLSSLVITFLPRSKHLLISWLQLPSTVILEPRKIKYVVVSIFSPSIFHELMGPNAMSLVFWMLSFKPAFSFPSFILIKIAFRSSSLSAIKMESSAYLRLLMFLPAVLISACNSSRLSFHMMYSAYKFNKQGDNIQTCHTPFSILNQSVVPCLLLTCFLTCIQVSQDIGKVVGYSLLLKNCPQFVEIHTKTLG